MSGVALLTAPLAHAPRRTKRTKPKPFISYRYSDCLDISGRLYDRLALAFGPRNVLKDAYCFEAGTDIAGMIERIVPLSTAVIALIGPEWFVPKSKGRTKAKSQRSSARQIDYLRLELQCALKHGIPIIPVLVNGTKLPAAKSVPAELRPLLRMNAIPLRSDPDFPGDANRLIEHLLKKTALEPQAPVRKKRK
jgi:hypothetical protein